ncbi:MAG: glycosyltransferase [Roseburia sp.]|nr:glycosyltransferase [Roseburia sp.]MCM1099725.1 glycosyltransferase [Ruminococcus flavefaciens]
MGKLSIANLKKTLYYLQRNGLRKTLSAAGERLRTEEERAEGWIPLPEEELERQRRQAESGFSGIRFSIVVPAYRTREGYLRQMLESVRRQTYSGWELLLADATEDDSVKEVAESFADPRIRYLKLTANRGISENTNAGIALASGDYIGLLDHDDVLTENALYEMAAAIEDGKERGTPPWLLYSDEDKCDGEGKRFYEPHRKEDFNLDLLLSNNYICHFMVMKRELMRELKLRKEFDGAQDHDLALRAAGRLGSGEIVHIPLILYHWRCHAASTAENPRSKSYAYEAGRRAVQDFADVRGWKARAEDTEHLGFYRLVYSENPLRVRPELGALGGRLVSRGKIVGGRMTAGGEVPDLGLPVSYSGYLHRAVLQQDAEALDLRSLELREELYDLFEETLGVPYRRNPETGLFDPGTMPEGTDWIETGVRLGKALRERGYLLLYLPEKSVQRFSKPARGCVAHLFSTRTKKI